jgi:predicted membrane channel-forming protein YqfA (hemolysin III family)
MRIGGAIVLLAVGAILTFAITVNNSHGFNVNTIGVILMIAGGIWLIAELVVYGSRRRTDVITQSNVAPPTTTTQYRY